MLILGPPLLVAELRIFENIQSQQTGSGEGLRFWNVSVLQSAPLTRRNLSGIHIG
jgi:hypothetical protein